MLQTLPERLRWARWDGARLTTRELAAAANVSDGYPSAIECGQFKNPTLDKLKALSDALGVSFEWLAMGHGRRPSLRALRKRGAELKKGRAA